MAGHEMRHARDAMILEAADLLKLIGNPNRLAILCRLCEGEASVGEMETELGIRQPTLSQQLGEFRKAGLVGFRREAKVVFYSLADGRTRSIIGHIHGLFCGDASRPARMPHPRALPRVSSADDNDKSAA